MLLREVGYMTAFAGKFGFDLIDAPGGKKLPLPAADIVVSVTGIVGPTGGTDEKPVGKVWIGLSVSDGEEITTTAEMKLYPNGRDIFKQLVGQAALMKVLRNAREL